MDVSSDFIPNPVRMESFTECNVVSIDFWLYKVKVEDEVEWLVISVKKINVHIVDMKT